MTELIREVEISMFCLLETGLRSVEIPIVRVHHEIEKYRT